MVRSIRVLHIEDEEDQRLLMAARLKVADEYAFDFEYADNEDAAVAQFDRGGVELVLLDYQLAQGNGLSCLKQLRGRDQIVPILAISGMATPQIAADLVAAGADDFLNKLDLDDERLLDSVRNCLRRTEAYSRRVKPETLAKLAQLEQLLAGICQLYAQSIPAEMVGLLDQFSAQRRDVPLTVATLQAMFESACQTAGCDQDRMRLRPVLLELMARSFDEMA